MSELAWSCRSPGKYLAIRETRRDRYRFRPPRRWQARVSHDPEPPCLGWWLRPQSGCRGDLGRQRDREHGFPGPAGERDPPAHPLDRELAEGEAESRVARGLVGGRSAAAAELLEDQGLIL